MGKSERILDEALGDARSEVAVASKTFPIAPFPPMVKQRERGSAQRLQLDRIPLYQVHQPNPVIPDSVIMPGMRSLLDSGAIGAGRRVEPFTRAMAEGRRGTRAAGDQQRGPSSPSPAPVRSTIWCRSPSARTAS